MIKLILVATLMVALSSARITIPLTVTRLNTSLPGLHQGMTRSFLMADDELTDSNFKKFNTSIKNSKDLAYFGDIYVGENTKFKVLFDTGSNLLWLPTTDCLECPAKTKYTCSASSTCSMTEKAIGLTYGLGYVEGRYGFEKAGFTADTKSNSTILWVYSGHDLDNYGDLDGFVGLGSMEETWDMIDLAYHYGHIQDKVFSFYLDHNGDMNNFSDGSYLEIGYIPEDRVDKLTWVNVTNPDRWCTKVLSMKVGDKVVDTSSDKNAKEVLFDSGWSLLALSPYIITELKTQLANLDTLTLFGTTRYRCDADYLDNYPNITVVVDGMEIAVGVSSYLFFISPVSSFGKNYCDLAVQESTLGFQILGDAFLRNNLVVFSKRNQTMGIYQEYRPVVLPAPRNYAYLWIVVGIAGIVFMIWRRKQNQRLLMSIALNTTKRNDNASNYYQAEDKSGAL